MAEDFFSSDMLNLFHNKFIIIIGDSVMRGAYKDLVHFIQHDTYITRADLRKKGEDVCMGDGLMERSLMTNKTHYREIRQYKTDTVLIRFYFITQVYNQYFETIVEDLLHESSPQPDVIMMNSCLWDMSRYGPRWLNLYRENLDKMLNSIKIVAKDSLFIWLTCMPVGKRARGGFLPRGVDWKKGTLRLDVLEANFFARQAVEFHGFDVVDLNYNFREMIHLRTDDDIHWQPEAHRRMTCLILNHICDAWHMPKPRRIKPLTGLDLSSLGDKPRHHSRHLSTPALHPNNIHQQRHKLQMHNPGFIDFNNNNINNYANQDDYIYVNNNNNNYNYDNKNNNYNYDNNNNIKGNLTPFFDVDQSQLRSDQPLLNFPPNWGGNYGRRHPQVFPTNNHQPHKMRNPRIMRDRYRWRNGPY